MRSRADGFTLIELMMVVAVIAVLSAIAYPAYSSYVRKAARGQAKADLVELSQLAERYHTVHNGYEDFGLPFDASPRQGTAKYNLELEDVTATTYTLKAVPTGGQTSDSCGTLTLNQAGVKTPAETTVSGCW
ncbi:type IV pilin protein [[Pseudomonas] boreopolis]|uniref:type IV pilin protein n=1 Tax=Xanthomonas boreopolis TaxID=86183 RepID=UPI003D9AC2BC